MPLAVLAFLVTCAYWPGIASAATCPRWTLLAVGVPSLLMFVPRIRVTLAHAAGALFVAWAYLTYLWSGSPLDTIGWGFKLAILSGAFCLGSQTENLRPVVRAMALGLLPCGAIAIAQYLGWHGLPENASPSGLYVNRNFFAEASAMIAVGLVAEGDWRFLPLTGPGLILTGARGALFGLLAGLLPMSRRALKFAAVPLIAASLLFAYALATQDLKSMNVRMVYWKATVAQLDMFGHGFGAYFHTIEHPSLDLLPVNQPGHKELFDHAHNEFLEIAFELGWLGLGLFIGLLFLLFRSDVSSATFVVICGIAQAFFEFPWHEPVTAFLWTVAAGHLARGLPDARHALVLGRNRIRTWQGRDRDRSRIPPSVQGAGSLPVRSSHS